jgi:hypothetical protein
MIPSIPRPLEVTFRKLYKYLYDSAIGRRIGFSIEPGPSVPTRKDPIEYEIFRTGLQGEFREFPLFYQIFNNFRGICPFFHFSLDNMCYK